jgi:hypothetical protein
MNSNNKYIGFYQLGQIVQNESSSAQMNQIFSLLNKFNYHNLTVQDSFKIIEQLNKVEITDDYLFMTKSSEKLFSKINNENPDFVGQLYNATKNLSDKSFAKQLAGNLNSIHEKNELSTDKFVQLKNKHPSLSH